MLRISMFVVVVTLLLASTAVAARDAGPGVAAGETCAEKQEAEKNATPRASTTRGGVPARETKAKAAGVGSDLPGSRLQSPRWHSFLPGMFR